MCEEDFYKDEGVAYNTDNFDEFDDTNDFECNGCFEDCPYGEDARTRCGAYAQCAEDSEDNY